MYPVLRRDYDSMLKQFSATFAKTFLRPDNPNRSGPHVQEIIRLQRELGESLWRAGVLIAGTLPRSERTQEFDRIEEMLKAAGWPHGSFPRPNSVVEFDFSEYRREFKRLTQINRQLISCCTTALKAHRKRPAPVPCTVDLEWQDFHALMNKAQAFNPRALRALAREHPELNVLLQLLGMQGDSLWNLALMLTSHMDKQSQRAELDKTERQMRSLGWDDLRFKRPGFFFRPNKAQFPRAIQRFEKINSALQTILGVKGPSQN